MEAEWTWRAKGKRMNAPDLDITEAIRSLAPPDDERHAARIAGVADAVAAYIQTLNDLVAGDRISMAMDYLTLCRTLAVQKTQLLQTQQQILDLQDQAKELRSDIDTLRADLRRAEADWQ